MTLFTAREKSRGGEMRGVRNVSDLISDYILSFKHRFGTQHWIPMAGAEIFDHDFPKSRLKTGSYQSSQVTNQNPSDPAAGGSLTENELCAVIGVEGIQRLVAAFYRQIPTDSILGPMYPSHDLAGAEERLRLFLTFRFGGPQDYLQLRGHPALRMRHAPFAIDQKARDRWMQLMNNAIDECQFATNAASVLRAFLGNVATFLMNR